MNSVGQLSKELDSVSAMMDTSNDTSIQNKRSYFNELAIAYKDYEVLDTYIFR